MKVVTVKSDLLLLATAIIWGFAFVAQRVGMDYVGPFTFNGIRFAIGSLSLLPLVLMGREKPAAARHILPRPGIKTMLLGGAALGLTLFAGASLQQIGLVYTTAGKAGFITGLYVIIVPILGLIWRQQPSIGTWIGAVLAAIGLYLLSINEEFTIEPGDLLVLVGAFFWAAHVLIIGWLSPRINPIKLAFSQYVACSILSLAAAFIMEAISLGSILKAAIPILYGGVLSVGIAYTLQVVAQRDAHPAHAAILLSLESVFAAVGGWLILREMIAPRGLTGCGLMLLGMLLSQLWSLVGKKA
jgi:drug/metabolite transporter (DMT)-like permease